MPENSHGQRQPSSVLQRHIGSDVLYKDVLTKTLRLSELEIDLLQASLQKR